MEFPYSLYSRDPLYASPLRKVMKEQFSSKNPFFHHAEAEYFIAKRGGETVGSIASITNHRHSEFHKEPVGFFGFFESINDHEVSDLNCQDGPWSLDHKGTAQDFLYCSERLKAKTAFTPPNPKEFARATRIAASSLQSRY